MNMQFKTPWKMRFIARRLVCIVAVLALPWSLMACSADRAPESSFVLLDGSTLTSAQLKGKVYLVNFWATSCASCVAEMPDLAIAYNEFKDRGFETIAVSMHYDPPSYVVHFAETRQLPFKVAIDNTGLVAHQWGDVQVTPTTFLVNKRAQIVKRFEGTPDFAALHRLIDELLSEP